MWIDFGGAARGHPHGGHYLTKNSQNDRPAERGGDREAAMPYRLAWMSFARAKVKGIPITSHQCPTSKRASCRTG